jgi:hypothetical protein
VTGPFFLDQLSICLQRICTIFNNVLVYIRVCFLRHPSFSLVQRGLSTPTRAYIHSHPYTHCTLKVKTASSHENRFDFHNSKFTPYRYATNFISFPCPIARSTRCGFVCNEKRQNPKTFENILENPQHFTFQNITRYGVIHSLHLSFPFICLVQSPPCLVDVSGPTYLNQGLTRLEHHLSIFSSAYPCPSIPNRLKNIFRANATPLQKKNVHDDTYATHIDEPK